MTNAKLGGLLTPEGIFASYESIRDRLPAPDGKMPDSTQSIPDLGAVADDYDVFVFDAFGVLNVGETTIPGATARLDQLQRAGKAVFVLTNGASQTRPATVRKFLRLGFSLDSEQIISSREALLAGLPDYAHIQRWGAIIAPADSLEELPAGTLRPQDEGFLAADGFLFMGGKGWDETRQRHWLESLQARPRPVLLGNPDLTAPYEGNYQLQPGYYCLQAMPEALRPWVKPFGKPFPAVFNLLNQRLSAQGLAGQRVLMVGDTLHTDVLGGAAAGFDTALVTGYGAHKGMPMDTCYAASGLRPNWQVPGI